MVEEFFSLHNNQVQAFKRRTDGRPLLEKGSNAVNELIEKSVLGEKINHVDAAPAYIEVWLHSTGGPEFSGDLPSHGLSVSTRQRRSEVLTSLF